MTEPVKTEDVCAAYIRYFETMRPETIDMLDNMAVENLYFEDPFNRLTSRVEVKQLFHQMFDHVENPAFEVSNVCWNANAEVAILKWRFTGNARLIGRIDFEGLSEVRFNDCGRIVSHVDYWDAAAHFHEKIPLLGQFLRLLKRAIRLS